MTIRFKAAGVVEIHDVRRIEQDHEKWFVWYGKPQDGSAFLHPQIFMKSWGTMEIIKEAGDK